MRGAPQCGQAGFKLCVGMLGPCVAAGSDAAPAGVCVAPTWPAACASDCCRHRLTHTARRGGTACV